MLIQDLTKILSFAICRTHPYMHCIQTNNAPQQTYNSVNKSPSIWKTKRINEKEIEENGWNIYERGTYKNAIALEILTKKLQWEQTDFVAVLSKKKESRAEESKKNGEQGRNIHVCGIKEFRLKQPWNLKEMDRKRMWK